MRKKAAMTRGTTAKTKEPSFAMEGQCGEFLEALCSTLAQHKADDPRIVEGYAQQTVGSRAQGDQVQDHLLMGVRRCGTSEHAFSHTATSPTGLSATSVAQPSKRPLWLLLNSFHAEQSLDARNQRASNPKAQAVDDGGGLLRMEPRRSLQQGT